MIRPSEMQMEVEKKKPIKFIYFLPETAVSIMFFYFIFSFLKVVMFGSIVELNILSVSMAFLLMGLPVAFSVVIIFSFFIGCVVDTLLYTYRKWISSKKGRTE